MANNQPSRKEVVLAVAALAAISVLTAHIGLSLLADTAGTPPIQPIHRGDR